MLIFQKRNMSSYFRREWYSGSYILEEKDIQILIFQKRRIFRFLYFRRERYSGSYISEEKVYRFLYFRREGYTGSYISEEKVFRFLYFRREGYLGSCISEEKDIQVQQKEVFVCVYRWILKKIKWTPYSRPWSLILLWATL